MTKKQEELIDPSLYEEAYYDQEAIDREIEENMFKLCGDLPMIKSPSKDFYRIDPMRLFYYRKKLRDFLLSLEKVPDSRVRRYVSDGEDIDWEKWKETELNFIRHLEAVGLVVGPLRSYRKVLNDEMIYKTDSVETMEYDLVYEKMRTIQCTCEISGVYVDKIHALIDAFDCFLFSYDFSESNDVEPGIIYMDSEGKCNCSKQYRTAEEIPDFGVGKMIMSGELFEKILGLFESYGVFRYFEKFPDKMKEFAVNSGIRKRKYQVYCMEYFLFHVWNLNEIGVWGKMISFIDDILPDGKRLAESLKFLLQSEGINGEQLQSDVPKELSSEDASQSDIIFEFDDVFINFSEQTIRIGLSRDITTKSRDGKYIKSIDHSNDPYFDDFHPSNDTEEVDIGNDDFIRGLKGLGVFIRFGKNVPGLERTKVYLEGKDNKDKLVAHTLQITTSLSNFFTKKASADLDSLFRYARNLLEEFDSRLIINKEKIGQKSEISYENPKYQVVITSKNQKKK